ncbi:MAG TPA: hypothetical protein VGG85_00600 [Terracidiphilus sp.]|jgi:hypothetical protein
MKSTLKSQIISPALGALLLAVLLTGVSLLRAQAPARFVGSVTAISGTTLTVKTDAGDQKQVGVPAETPIKRIAPGEKDLSKAAAITFADLAVGDRVLVRLNPDAQDATPQAAQIIAVKQEDLAQKQQKESEDWQRRGIGGLVKSVDASSGTLVVTTGAGATAKTVTVHTNKATTLKRYAPGSVRFDEAKAAGIDAIKAGDQLRARGEKSADGSEITAEEVVSGSFRNVSGTIASLDASSSSFVVKDLATKKTVTVLVTPESQMRRLPERMAQMLATRLKGGGAPGAAGPGGPGAGGGPGGAGQPPAGGLPQQHSSSGGGQGGGPGAGGPGGGSGGGDLQMMLSRAPAIQLADLQKGEAVMLVSTEGTNGVTAITLLAGVEPLLQAPAASQNLLSNWSMGSGGAAEGGGTQ